MMNWIERATFWDWLTNVTGLVAVAMLALLIIGFRRYIWRKRTEPIDYIGGGIWMLALFQMGRLLWWDIAPDVFEFEWRDYGITGSHINWIFNSLIVVGTWYKLRGYWIVVNHEAPGEYNTFTSVFYPKRLRLWLDSRAQIEKVIQEDKDGL